MKNKFSIAMTLAVILAMIAATFALADQVSNNVDASVDAAFETMALNVDGPTGSTTLRIIEQNGDGKPGCNLQGPNKQLTVSIASSDTLVATVNPESITFSDCNDTTDTTITVTPNGEGSAEITLDLTSFTTNSSGVTSDSFDLLPGRFTVNVAPPPNTAPVVTVTGVIHGQTYEFGTVPAAGCLVEDAEDGNSTPPASLSDISGALSAYGLGTQTATCSYTDSGGLNTTVEATYEVIDTMAPSLSVPSNITVEATGSSGATVSYSASATDAVDPAPVVSCSPASGSTFPLGTTAVSCSAADAAGNSASSGFSVTVQDTTTPALSLPSNITAEATSASGAVVTYSASAMDLVDGSVAVSCLPASGSTFSLGTTAVSCSATDAAGNPANGGFNVTVQDTTAPVIAGHGDETVEATSSLGAIVSYTSSTTSDAVDSAGAATCAPASGTQFALGDTTVTCDASDAAGNDAVQTSFVVHVVDTTDPTITFVSRTAANANSWNNGNVTVNWSCSDAVGVVSAAVSKTVSAEGSNQSATGTCTDTSGNTAFDTQMGINIDKTKPSASASRTPAANSFGWNNSDVTVSFSGTDDLSGIDFCSADEVFGEGANQSATGICTDEAGNVSDDATISDINVDKTAPTIIGAPDRAANGAGWYNADVTVSFTCDDDLSGVDACSAPSTLGEGENQSVTGNVTDKAGNNASDTVSGINIDKTAPAISAALDISPDASGWFNASTGAPTVSFTCDDALSGLDSSCPASRLFGDGENQSYSQTVYDLAGNSNSAGVSDVDVDTVAPSISVALDRSASASGWFNLLTGAPVAEFTCSDGTSGVASCPSDSTFGEGENLSHSGTAYDVAGNSASASVNDVDVDLTAPTITAALDRSADASGWFNASTGAPTVEFTCSDALSGLDSCPSDFTFGQGADQSHSGTAFDNAGNSSSDGVSDVDVDTVAPSISVALDRLPAASGWFNETTGAPVAEFTCSDGTSGVVACPADYPFSNGENQSHSDTVYDNAGNSASDSISNVDVDLIDPTLTWIGGPADGSSHYFGSVPAAPTCSAADALSGPDACAVAGHSTAVGPHTLTATAHDVAGNAYTETRSYTVLAWTLKGFYQPVDMGNVWNTVKNGSTVPLKFEVFAGTTELTDIAIVDTLKYTQIACSALPSAVEDAIETLSSSGSTVLRYDSTGGQFIFNWQTPKTVLKCYQVTLITDDGSRIDAFFKLK